MSGAISLKVPAGGMRLCPAARSHREREGGVRKTSKKAGEEARMRFAQIKSAVNRAYFQ